MHVWVDLEDCRRGVAGGSLGWRGVREEGVEIAGSVGGERWLVTSSVDGRGE